MIFSPNENQKLLFLHYPLNTINKKTMQPMP